MNIETIKTFQTLKTPFYYYDTTLLQATLQAASQAANEHGFNLHYAIKANANPHILDIIQSHGIGADCVSGNEVAQAVASGFPSEQIVYAGVGADVFAWEEAYIGVVKFVIVEKKFSFNK